MPVWFNLNSQSPLSVQGALSCSFYRLILLNDKQSSLVILCKVTKQFCFVGKGLVMGILSDITLSMTPLICACTTTGLGITLMIRRIFLEKVSYSFAT